MIYGTIWVLVDTSRTSFPPSRTLLLTSLCAQALSSPWKLQTFLSLRFIFPCCCKKTLRVPCWDNSPVIWVYSGHDKKQGPKASSKIVLIAYQDLQLIQF